MHACNSRTQKSENGQLINEFSGNNLLVSDRRAEEEARKEAVRVCRRGAALDNKVFLVIFQHLEERRCCFPLQPLPEFYSVLFCFGWFWGPV